MLSCILSNIHVDFFYFSELIHEGKVLTRSEGVRVILFSSRTFLRLSTEI